MAIDLPAQATLQAWLDQAALWLTPNCDSARLDAELLLAEVLHQTRGFLLAHAHDAFGAEAALQYRRLVARRAAGEPLAYILGRREFWSLELQVTPDVLVPRPETELVVERCLALLGDGFASVADLGTGSGAIALALAYERPQWQVVATDVSAAALAVARANAQRLGFAHVEFLQGDWLHPLTGRRLTLIASNPPYIRAGDPALQDPALRCEPPAALTPGPAGLEALWRIVTEAYRHLQPGGALVLEHGADQAAELAQMLVAHGYARVRCHPDLAGLDRVTEALRP